MIDARQEFVLKAQRDGMPFAALCRQFGISRKTGYKWLGRAQEDGLLVLADRSRRPHKSATQTDEEVMERHVRREVGDRHPVDAGRPAVGPDPMPGGIQVFRTPQQPPQLTVCLTAVCLRRVRPLPSDSAGRLHRRRQGRRGLRGPNQFGPSRLRETFRSIRRRAWAPAAYSRLVSGTTTTSADPCPLPGDVSASGAPRTSRGAWRAGLPE